MKFTKHILKDIDLCYATLATTIDKKDCLFFAGEGDGSFYAFQGEHFQEETLIWKGGGGTMSIATVPDHEDCILASRGFYTMVESDTSSIEFISYQNQKFAHRPIAYLPYLHRFSVVSGGDNRKYIVACSIASHKKDFDDWSSPGHIYWGLLPEILDDSFQVELHKLNGDFTANHGFCLATVQGQDCVFIGATEGGFCVTPPDKQGGEWSVTQWLDTPVSDLAVLDLDGDGELEIAVISPFHGNGFHIYKKGKNGYAPIYEYPEPHDFYHTVVASQISGKPTIIGGGRRLAMELFALSWNFESQSIDRVVLDKGVGPSNAAVYHLVDKTLVLSANREISQAAYYEIEPL